MRKFLLYLLATVLSFGIWFLVCTQTIPFIAWIFNLRIARFAKSICLTSMTCSIIGLILLAFLWRKKKCGEILLASFAFFVSFMTCWMYYEYTRETYGNLGSWSTSNNNFCYGSDHIYNKFGKEVIYTGYKERNISHDYIFIYDWNCTGSIWDIAQKKYVLNDTNLKYAGEIFENNGQYGIALKSDGAIIVEPRYEYISFYSNGFIKATRNGKYGILDPLGWERTKFIYTNTQVFEEGTDGIYVKTNTEDGDETIYYLTHDSEVRKELTTNYRVVKICDSDRFIVKDDNGYYCIVNGRNKPLTDWYYDIYYYGNGKFEGRETRSSDWTDLKVND